MSSVAHTVIFEFTTLITSLEILIFHGIYYYDGLCIGEVHVTGICTAYGAVLSFTSVLHLYFSVERGEILV